MKNIIIIAMFLALLLIAGCSRKEAEQAEVPSEAEEQEQACTLMWVCTDDNTRAYRKSDCTFEQITNCPNGCENGNCKEVKADEKPESEKPAEEIQINEMPSSEDKISKEIQEIFGYSKTRLTSYSYLYRDASGQQYNMYVKGDKIKMDYISDSDPKQIYLDTQKKTAEEYCISHSKCGKKTGKIADLDYSKVYVKTPVDWISEITEAKSIGEGAYMGKRGGILSTNIGEVIIDSYYGFIFNINQGGKSYSFTNAVYNVVKDSDVNIPEYLLP